MEQKKKRIPIPFEKKVRAELQKEISSKCPFCQNEDVGLFEIHHIDEDRSNNEYTNLFLLCSPCHKKIHYKQITINDVIKKKMELMNKVVDGKEVIIEETIDDEIAKFNNENKAIKAREEYLNSTQKNIDQRTESTYLIDRFKSLKEKFQNDLGVHFFEPSDHKINYNGKGNYTFGSRCIYLSIECFIEYRVGLMEYVKLSIQIYKHNGLPEDVGGGREPNSIKKDYKFDIGLDIKKGWSDYVTEKNFITSEELAKKWGTEYFEQWKKQSESL